MASAIGLSIGESLLTSGAGTAIIGGVEKMLGSGGIKSLVDSMEPKLTTALKGDVEKELVQQEGLTPSQAIHLASKQKDQGLMGIGGDFPGEPAIGNLNPEVHSSEEGITHTIPRGGHENFPSAKNMSDDDKEFFKQLFNPEQPERSLYDKVKGGVMSLGSQAVGGAAFMAPTLFMHHGSVKPPEFNGFGTVNQVNSGMMDHMPGLQPETNLIHNYDPYSAYNRADMYAKDMITGNANQKDVNRNAVWQLANFS